MVVWLFKEFKFLGFEVIENFGGYGIVGVMKNGLGLIIFYCMDMDVLLMFEKMDFVYVSKKVIEYNG